MNRLLRDGAHERDPNDVPAKDPEQPQTLHELETLLRDSLPVEYWNLVLPSVRGFILRLREETESSKAAGIKAVREGFAEQVTRLKEEVSAISFTSSSNYDHFERIIADLQRRVGEDPKTRLLNYERFMQGLELFLYTRRRTEWTAVGVIDITKFKSVNDRYGHDVGDKVIDQVSLFMTDLIRSTDQIGIEDRRHQDRRRMLVDVEADRRNVEHEGDRRRTFHARRGGDEFCFHIPDLSQPEEARAIAMRLADTVKDFDWRVVDPVLVERITIDVGVICLRHFRASSGTGRQLAKQLLDAADELMYKAKVEGSDRVCVEAVELGSGGEFVPIKS